MIDNLGGTADAAADQLGRDQKEAHGKRLHQRANQDQAIILNRSPG